LPLLIEPELPEPTGKEEHFISATLLTLFGVIALALALALHAASLLALHASTSVSC
jgi:hypothetical protein